MNIEIWIMGKIRSIEVEAEVEVEVDIEEEVKVEVQVKVEKMKTEWDTDIIHTPDGAHSRSLLNLRGSSGLGEWNTDIIHTPKLNWMIELSSYMCHALTSAHLPTSCSRTARVLKS